MTLLSEMQMGQKYSRWILAALVRLAMEEVATLEEAMDLRLRHPLKEDPMELMDKGQMEAVDQK